MDGWTVPALVLLGGYLLGSIPFGVIVTKVAGGVDPRTIGSGNIGATNVLRTGRKGLAALTLLLDGGKGAVAVLIAEAVAPSLGVLAAVGAFCGHLFPVWLGFKGGKGVATLLGIALALHWPTGLIALAVWLLATAITRISSVGGMSAAISAAIAAAFFSRFDLSIYFLAFALMVLWKHRENIARLLQGTEPRIGRKNAG
ncbi:glycerol-3-phosphate 1-O-acyltransferase PlsY [Sphingomonas sp. MMS24-J13]|uniref:glycerol-3-phosphate 1-O-acyltransferase PlsY n=1 Tax=Sphingomonas sp. MMS24-J13 TaxID=3238686 RepID=UPI00384C1C27